MTSKDDNRTESIKIFSMAVDPHICIQMKRKELTNTFMLISKTLWSTWFIQKYFSVVRLNTLGDADFLNTSLLILTLTRNVSGSIISNTTMRLIPAFLPCLRVIESVGVAADIHTTLNYPLRKNSILMCQQKDLWLEMSTTYCLNVIFLSTRTIFTNLLRKNPTYYDVSVFKFVTFMILFHRKIMTNVAIFLKHAFKEIV